MKLFTCGPVQMYPSTQNIAQNGYTYFRTDTYGNIVKNCMMKISEMLGHKYNNNVIYLAASGSGAMDAVVDNCMTKSDKALVINGGSFGHRFCELLKWYGIEYDSIDLEWNEVVEAEDLKNFENKGYTALFVNLDETSSGKLYDIGLLSNFCKRNNMYLIVDAISAFLADDYNMDKYGVDVTIISSQKGLCLSPGMSILAFSDRMVDKINKDSCPKSYYFNLKDYFKNMDRGQTPFTPTVSIIYELQDMLNLIEKSGGKEIWIKNVENKCKYFRKKAATMGFTIPDYPKSNTLTPIYFEDINAGDVVRELREKYDLFVNPCGGKMADKLIRVAHIGNLSISDFDNLLEKMDITVKELKEKQLQGVS